MTPAGNLAWPGHSVIREILRRRDHHVLGNSQEAKASAVKLALVVEGGGMRGIYSGGVMVSMEELGLSGVFDNVYGESAGGPNCCYFLSGQGKLGIRIYLEDLPSRKFVNPVRLGRMLDVDYVVDEVIAKIKPLDSERVLQSPSDLFLSVTHALTGRPRLIDVKRDGVPLLTVLKASAAIVPLYNHYVWIDGEPYVDGGIANPIPITNAVEHGCTHILVLLTRPRDFVNQPLPWWHRAWVRRLGRRWTPAFQDVFYARHASLYNRSRDLVFGCCALPPGIEIAFIAPRIDSPAMGRATVSKPTLHAALADAKRTALEVFT